LEIDSLIVLLVVNVGIPETLICAVSRLSTL
jgi:hypothetical protein